MPPGALLSRPDAAKPNANRTLLITGAGSGIGAATARRFVADGGRVALLDRDEAGIQALASELGRATAVRCDVTDEEQIDAAVRTAHAELGRIDCLVNSAGIADSGPLTGWSLQRWNLLHSIHVGGTFLLCRAVLPIMQAQGGGSIVNVASIAALIAQGDNVAYGSAKAAIAALSMQLARDAAPNIRVNAIAPGRVRTAMTEPLYRVRGRGDAEKGAAMGAAANPLNRVAEPHEIAGPICFLLSQDASFITGQLIVVDGGETIV